MSLMFFSAHFIHIAFGVRPSRMLRFDSDLFYLVVIASEEGRIEGGRRRMSC